jgi:excisionase family DNA binding protein
MNEPILEPMAVSAAEAARLLGVSRPKVYELLNRADFPAFKLGGRTLISVDGLRRWVEQQAGGGENG